MILVSCRNDSYLYNAYHMVKAFFPEEEVHSSVEEKASHFATAEFPDGSRLILDTEGGREKDKHVLDRQWYRMLAEKAGRTLAWGTLLGVRPTKLAFQKREEGFGREEILSWFREEYLVSEDKAALAWDISGRERTLLGQLDLNEGYSLYIGIPFCPTVCSYCSFSSGAIGDWADRVTDYLDALCRELASIAECSAEKHLNCIYIGGGTPTSLSARELERLLSFVDEHFDRSRLLEYTVEAGRPDSITREKLEVMKKHGVTRISVNPQTMQQKTLDLIGRKHTVEEIEEVFCLAREIGFDNINMDLIAGLPGEGPAEMQDTLEKVGRLSPDSLTVHSLAIKRAARMGQEEQKARMGTDIGEMTRMAEEAAGRMGLTPYYLYRQKNIAGNFENVGYAKVDKAGIYNILIMEEKQSILAAGAGASSKIVLKEPCPMPGSRKKKLTNLIRIENVKAIDAYIERIDEMIQRKGEWLWH